MEFIAGGRICKWANNEGRTEWVGGIIKPDSICVTPGLAISDKRTNREAGFLKRFVSYSLFKLVLAYTIYSALFIFRV